MEGHFVDHNKPTTTTTAKTATIVQHTLQQQRQRQRQDTAANIANVNVRFVARRRCTLGIQSSDGNGDCGLWWHEKRKVLQTRA
ncbi:PREDICTED: uncharacterized protein LOC108614176 isoform X3 [Drosophila arizonae]|uniref:Uncharacterized protein LOC108614176 isoform X3 n=1 Tax=Drosophila arizonae TaxID=7263 RepID=A0ABM1P8V3_DROAR|nr:PREDICTED: uncharacterized protein LOC108614176 isoform X3 [Drosophila arizonae]